MQAICNSFESRKQPKQNKKVGGKTKTEFKVRASKKFTCWFQENK